MFAVGLKKLTQIGRTGDQSLVQRTATLSKRAFELAEAAREGKTNLVNALGEPLADLLCTAGKGGVELLDGLSDCLADFLGAPCEQLSDLPGFAIESGVDIACMKTQRLIKLLCPRGERIGDSTACLVEIAGIGRKGGDDAFLKLGDPAIQTRSDFVGPAAKQRIEL